jgi:hypothetical protein
MSTGWIRVAPIGSLQWSLQSAIGRLRQDAELVPVSWSIGEHFALVARNL